jgi:hypothetical protein
MLRQKQLEDEAPSRPQRTIKVMDLLDKVKSKIEQRTKRDYFDMQQTYYYRTLGSIPHIGELKKALEHYHIRLPEIELEILYGLFPYRDGKPGFDFRRFSCALFPRPDRKADLMNPDYLLSMQPDWGTPASAAPFGRVAGEWEQQIHRLRPKTKADNPSHKHTLKADVYLDGYINNNIVKSHNVDRVVGEWEIPRLGEGLNYGGATTYYQKPPRTVSAGADVGGSPYQTRQSGRGRPQYQNPAELSTRLHAYQQYHDKPGPALTQARPQMYPVEEFTHGLDRFHIRTPQMYRRPIEVSRRNNISRGAAR